MLFMWHFMIQPVTPIRVQSNAYLETIILTEQGKQSSLRDEHALNSLIYKNIESF